MHHDHVIALAQMRHEQYQDAARAAARAGAARPKRRRPLMPLRVRLASPGAADAPAALASRR